MKTALFNRGVSPRKKESGLSLVLVLFAVLCLSFLVVLFFSLASNDRASTAAFTSSLKADELATGGLELVIAELRREIADGDRSQAFADPLQKGPTVYLPKQAKYAVPERTASDSFGNLLKVSARDKPLFTGTGATLLGAAASSATASRNGRSVSVERWNKPVLGAFDGSTVPVPDWIYLDRKGPISSPVLADASDPSKQQFVLGRIAFAVYDIGGLLDANVAGYPIGLPALEVGRKGSAALARLQVLGLSDDAVTSLVDFRNATSKADYKKYLEDNEHKAFTETKAGDNRFVSRQELIRFAKRAGFADKLYFFDVFSRETNAPSFQPDNPDSANPILASLRHATSGRLLLEKRFPLSRLQLFADPATKASEIEKFFGLTYVPDSRSFTYKNSRIATLAQVAAESEFREPDFFELLKAAISSGSIGQSAGTTASIADDPDKDAHIMQIGANIIDQYDLDSDGGGKIPIPTTIAFAGNTLYGVENLPYVNKIQFLGETVRAQPVSEANAGNLVVGYENNQKNGDAYGFVAAAELWNPTFQKTPDAAKDYNPEIQVTMSGQAGATMYASYDAEPPPGGGSGTGSSTPPYDSPKRALDSSRKITVNQNLGSWMSYGFFSEPRGVRMTSVMPQFTYDKKKNQVGNPDYLNFCFNSARFKLERVAVELAVVDGNGVPRTYQKTLPTDLAELKLSQTTTPNAAAARVGGSSSIVHSDPRTNRLGYFGMNFRPSQATPVGASDGAPGSNPKGSLPQFYSTRFAPNPTTSFSLRPRFDRIGMAGDPNGFGIATTDGLPGSGYSPASQNLYLGLLWENTINQTRVQDPDGKFRLGDGGFAPANSIPNPYEPIHILYSTPTAYSGDSTRAAGSNVSRPVVLDRPFRSIADMGYTFRDVPWRSLNFSSTDSGDAALLDVFSIEDNETIAGRVNLNSAPSQVLQALIAGSLKDEKSDTSGLKDSEALAAAQQITQFIKDSGPITNIAELVTKFSTPAHLTTAELGTTPDGAPSASIKTQRESLIRALAGTTQTRTWNFLIDLVAQTGRFPKGANNLNDFSVEGERRYWLHIAIDRYTGEVVSELLETVND